MISLDDEVALRAADPSGLLDAFATLPRQLHEGYELGRAVEIPGDGPPDLVVLCGMGGSAAAADVAALAAHRLGGGPPLIVVRGYDLPWFVNERSLVVCLSYSGETEEMLWAADEAAGRSGRLVCIASGGQLLEIGNVVGVRIPHLVEAPRAALGALAGAAIGVLVSAGVTRVESSDHDDELFGPKVERLFEPVLEAVSAGTAMETNAAKQLAAWLGDRVPVVWGASQQAAAAALRWKAAFNENAKMPAFASYLPELAHHEVVGWTKEWADRFAVVVLRSWSESVGPDHNEVIQEHSDRRLAAVLGLLDEAGIEHREVRTPIEAGGWLELVGLMAIGDFASAYHALMRGIDPAPIEAIARIKDKLR